MFEGGFFTFSEGCFGVFPLDWFSVSEDVFFYFFKEGCHLVEVLSPESCGIGKVFDGAWFAEIAYEFLEHYCAFLGEWYAIG